MDVVLICMDGYYVRLFFFCFASCWQCIHCIGSPAWVTMETWFVHFFTLHILPFRFYFILFFNSFFLSCALLVSSSLHFSPLSFCSHRTLTQSIWNGDPKQFLSMRSSTKCPPPFVRNGCCILFYSITIQLDLFYGFQMPAVKSDKNRETEREKGKTTENGYGLSISKHRFYFPLNHSFWFLLCTFKVLHSLIDKCRIVDHNRLTCKLFYWKKCRNFFSIKLKSGSKEPLNLNTF